MRQLIKLVTFQSFYSPSLKDLGRKSEDEGGVWTLLRSPRRTKEGTSADFAEDMKATSGVSPWRLHSGILLGIIFLVFLLFPWQRIAAADEIQNRCWLQENCESYNGIWGKGDNYRNLYGNGQVDEWSQKFCDNIGADKVTARCFAGNPTLPLQVGIPGVTEKFCSNFTLGSEPTACKIDDDCKAKGLGTCQPGIKGGFPGYVAAFYKFFVGFMAVVAVVMIMWGGFKRIMAAGNAENIKNANSTVFAAIIGLVLTLVSYTLLNLINPRLVANSFPLTEKIKPGVFGYCLKYNDAKKIYDNGYSYYVCSGGADDGLSCSKDTDCKPSQGQTKNGTCVVKDAKGNPGQTCGKKIVVNNGDCIGIECTVAGQGCFKSDTSDNYSCEYNWKKCEAVTADNIKTLSGVSTKDFLSMSGDSSQIGALNSVCDRYSSGSCVWTHSVNSKDQCHYYSDQAKQDACKNKTSCNDFNAYTPWANITNQIATGDNFVACFNNWCPGLSCKLRPQNSSGLQALTLTDFISLQWQCVDK